MGQPRTCRTSTHPTPVFSRTFQAAHRLLVDTFPYDTTALTLTKLLTHPEYRLFVSGDPVQAAALCRVAGSGPASLVYLAVESTLRSQGLGHTLLTRVLEDHLAGEGLICEVDPPTTPSARARLRFYRRFDAKVIDSRPDSYALWLPPSQGSA